MRAPNRWSDSAMRSTLQTSMPMPRTGTRVSRDVQRGEEDGESRDALPPPQLHPHLDPQPHQARVALEPRVVHRHPAARAAVQSLVPERAAAVARLGAIAGVVVALGVDERVRVADRKSTR